ncbi:MAG: ABC transporter ATP-binding protein, partial [Coriobacteriales bacterium]|nr:ABC transporter ATP-binding protein [Coriobacteriales bacterium]
VPVVIWILVGRERYVRTRAEATGASSQEAPAVEKIAADKSVAVQPGQDVVLAAQNLSVGYDGDVLVRAIDLKVSAGRVVALIGPNGAGKSTMLKTLSGGRVELAGRDLDGLSEHERACSCSVLLTDRPRTELLTCFDVASMGRYPYTGRLGVLSDEDRRKVDEALALMEVADLAATDFMQLSDGQRQRVLLARALCQEPQVLVLDEPTSYLDIRYQVGLLNTLRMLAAERGLAVVMSLHELSLARQVADWLVCVKDGGIVAQGASAHVFTDEVVRQLFDLEDGMFDAATGTVLLGAAKRGGGGHAEA